MCEYEVKIMQFMMYFSRDPDAIERSLGQLNYIIRDDKEKRIWVIPKEINIDDIAFQIVPINYVKKILDTLLEYIQVDVAKMHSDLQKMPEKHPRRKYLQYLCKYFNSKIMFEIEGD